MGARADAGVIAVAPIAKIVAAFLAGLGVVRYLVSEKTRPLQRRKRRLVEPGAKVFVGKREDTPLMGAEKGRAALDRQLIGGNMGSAQRQRLAELRPPALGALAREGVDQIEGMAGKVPLGAFERADCLPAAMGATEKPKRVVVQGLDPEGEAVDAGISEGLEPFGLDRGRIGLERDLAPRRHRPQGESAPDDRRDGLGFHQ